MDPDLKDMWQPRLPPRRCHACTAVSKAQKPYVEDGSKTRYPEHLRFGVALSERGIEALTSEQ